jgi:raffinose/stachyose/melibiose transport system substrate-binding protein
VLKTASDSSGLAMIPYTLTSSGIWFDAATHPEWVASPPATFDDLLTAAQKIKAAGRPPFAQDGTVNGYNAYWIYWLLMRHGGPGTLAALGKSADGWDNPAVLAAAQDVEKLVKADLIEPDYMATKYPAAQNQWAVRKEDMNINGTWLNSETSPDQVSGFQAQMFQFPSVPGGSDSVEVGSLGWSLNPKSPNLSTAESFLAFMMQKPYMSLISTQALNISPRSDVPAPPTLLAAQKAIINAKSVQGTDDNAPSLYSGWWNDVFLPLDDQLFSGKITAQQFVSMGKAQTASYH